MRGMLLLQILIVGFLASMVVLLVVGLGIQFVTSILLLPPLRLIAHLVMATVLLFFAIGIMFAISEKLDASNKDDVL